MKFPLKRVLVLISWSFAVSSVTAAGIGPDQIGPTQLIGFFTNMEMSPDTLDCSGYSVWLYRVGGKIVGNFHFYQGDCTTRKIPLGSVTLGATGDLSFEVEEDDLLFNFKGRLSDHRLAGVMAVFDQVGKENVSSKKETLVKMDDDDQRQRHAKPIEVTVKVDSGSGRDISRFPRMVATSGPERAL